MENNYRQSFETEFANNMRQQDMVVVVPQQQRKWPILIAGIASFLVAVIFLAVSFAGGGTAGDGKEELAIMVVPRTAKISIDGKTYENKATRIAPGTYKVKISKEGYKTKEMSITVKKGESAQLTAYLEWDTITNFSNEDYDILRFIYDESNYNLEKYITDYFAGVSDYYAKPSLKKGIIDKNQIPLSDEFTSHSRQMVYESVSAFLYYAYPDVATATLENNQKNYSVLDLSTNTGKKFYVYLVTSGAERDSKKDVYEIYILDTKTHGTLFHSTGAYVMDPNYATDYNELNDSEIENYN